MGGTAGLGLNPGIENFQADFNSLSARALAYIQANVGLTPPVLLENTVAADVPLTVKGASGQTASLLELTDNSDSVVAAVKASGDINVAPATGGYQIAGTDVARSTGSALNIGNAQALNLITGVFGSVALTGPGSVGGSFRATAFSPAQITANQNNYGIGTSFFARIQSDAARDITGLVTGGILNIDGDIRIIWNVGAFAISFTNEDAASTAANRILTSSGATVVLAANACAIAIYDGTSARWRLALLA